MKMKKPSMLKRLKKSHRGFTLIELLVVIALTSIISTAAAMSIHQVLIVPPIANNHNNAINNVRNAGYWISRDAQMARPDYIWPGNGGEDNEWPGDSSKSDGKYELLHLRWQDTESAGNWFTGGWYDVIFYFSGNSGTQELRRWYYCETDDETGDTIVARYIELASEGTWSNNPGSDETWCKYENGIITVKITAVYGDATEDRVYKIIPRPNW